MDQRLRQRLATVSPAMTQVTNNAKERYGGPLGLHRPAGFAGGAGRDHPRACDG